MLKNRQDIENRDDLERHLKAFYAAVTADKRLGRHFAELDLAAHLPVITDFWEKILFGKAVYFGNPLEIHRGLHRKQELTLEDFRRWVEIFEQTIDENFAGKTAENAKLRAKMIAHSLNQNLNKRNGK